MPSCAAWVETSLISTDQDKKSMLPLGFAATSFVVCLFPPHQKSSYLKKEVKNERTFETINHHFLSS